MVNEITSLVNRQVVAPTVTPVPNSKSAAAESSGSSQTGKVAAGRDVAASGKNEPAGKSPESAASPEDVMEAVHKMRDYMQIIDRDLHFSIDEQSGVTVIKVVDPATDEVVRQIPSEEALRVVRSLENGGGLLSSIKA